AIAVGLVVLACVDVARFALAGDRENARSLERALRLAPFDVPVRTAVARLEAAAGAPDAAIKSLRAAVAIDPYDVPAQRALARLLLERERFEEAYAQHAAMMRTVEPDVDT